jgi:histidyl-tRNA synthetase
MMELRLKFTDKENESYELILGEDNLAKGLVKLKNMLTGEEKTVALTVVADALCKNTESRCSEYVGGIH